MGDRDALLEAEGSLWLRVDICHSIWNFRFCWRPTAASPGVRACAVGVVHSEPDHRSVGSRLGRDKRQRLPAQSVDLSDTRSIRFWRLGGELPGTGLRVAKRKL